MLFDVVKDFALLPGIGIKFKGHGFGQYFTQINDAMFNDINIFLSVPDFRPGATGNNARLRTQEWR